MNTLSSVKDMSKTGETSCIVLSKVTLFSRDHKQIVPSTEPKTEGMFLGLKIIIITQK